MCRITLIIGYIAIAGLVATTGSCASNRSLADRIGMNMDDCPKGPDGQNDEVVLSETPLAKYKKLNTEDERVWIEPLMSMDLPSFSSKDDSLNVFFKIGTEINGYKVSCRFLPYGRCAETGHAVLSFVKGDLNLVLHVRKMMFYHTLLMTMAGHEWKNMDSYELNYVEPSDVDMNPVDDSHPFGYYNSFQFVDVDFDGKDELVLNDFYMGRQGNDYTVYKISGNQFVPYSSFPFNQLDNTTEFDSRNQSITTFISLNSSCGVYIFSSMLEEDESPVVDIPDFYSDSTSAIIREIISGPQVVSIDSVKEYAGDSLYVYRRFRQSLKLVSVEDEFYL